jgi:hypothetical protein
MQSDVEACAGRIRAAKGSFAAHMARPSVAGPAAGGTAGPAGAGLAARRRTVRSGLKCCGWPGRTSPGLPADPRLAGQARRHASAVHRVGDPQTRRDRTGAAPRRAGLGGVPAVPGAGDPGAGLLHRRPRQRNQGLYPGRHRARHSPHPDPRATEHPVQSWVVQQARPRRFVRCRMASPAWTTSAFFTATALEA